MAITAAVAEVDQAEDALEEGEDKMTPYLGRLAAVAGLGGLLFGFDTGVIGGILVVIGNAVSPPCPAGAAPGCVPRGLTPGEEELIVSATTAGALVGSLAAGWLGDAWGRKKVIVLAAALFALGAVEQAAADTLNMMTSGRLLVGLGVGLSSMVTPVYVAELSPAKYRGRLVALLVVLITGGQVLAYIVDAAFYSVASGWRYMSLAAAVPAFAQLILSLSLPESPRYLILRGRLAPARATLRKLYPGLGAEAVERKVDRIELALRRERGEGVGLGKRGGLKGAMRLLWGDRANRRALTLACGLQLFQQATGFNTLMYYSQKILASEGFARPSDAAIVIAASNWICTIVALRLIDSHGRRPLLLHSLAGMAGGLFCIGLTFLFVNKDPAEGQGAGFWGYLSVLSMVLFCCAFALGLGNVPWIVQSEIFTYEVRAVGNALSTATNWTANLIVSATFLHMAEAISPTGVFWFYGLVALVAFYFTYVYLPETKGLSLEDTRELFQGDGPTASEVTAAAARGREVGYEPVRSSGEAEETVV